MLPSRFDYHRASSVEEALSLLDDYGEDAKVLAGGQSLIPLMKLRFVSPGHLIDIDPIPGLDGIEEREGSLALGALVRHNQLASSEIITNGYPTLAAAAPQIADPIVRNLGTIGGSLAHADPAGDLGSVMLSMGANVVLRSSSGERVVPIGEFLVDTFTTSITPNELLTEIRIPTPPPRSGGSYLKLERKVGDFATVAVAVTLSLQDGTVGSAGIALTGVGLKNIEAAEAAASLHGTAPTDEAFAEAGRLAAAASNPVTDVRGTDTYKRHMVEVYTRRGLATASAMAAG
ncbi:MAG: xanthine dehydrogenase family protein subunit M [Actinobacteria bacterium]|nr:MAG: xanthine dehydrogenase family protein subunit M [Actinomycetota bacterium]